MKRVSFGERITATGTASTTTAASSPSNTTKQLDCCYYSYYNAILSRLPVISFSLGLVAAFIQKGEGIPGSCGNPRFFVAWVKHGYLYNNHEKLMSKPENREKKRFTPLSILFTINNGCTVDSAHFDKILRRLTHSLFPVFAPYIQY